MKKCSLPKDLSPMFFNLLRKYLAEMLHIEVLFAAKEEGLQGEITYMDKKDPDNPLMIFHNQLYGGGWGWDCKKFEVTSHMRELYPEVCVEIESMMTEVIL